MKKRTGRTASNPNSKNYQYCTVEFHDGRVYDATSVCDAGMLLFTTGDIEVGIMPRKVSSDPCTTEDADISVECPNCEVRFTVTRVTF